MRQALEKLMEIQNLEITLAETNILHREQPQSCIKRVQDQVAEKRRSLDGDLVRRYDQLRRNGTAVVAENSGVCGGCRLNIPRGDLRRMHRGAIPWVCPNCSRFVLLSQE